MQNVILNELVKVDKRKARKLFYKGATVYLWACKANIFSPWCSYCYANNAEVDFDIFVNEFEYYNCNYEMGYYAKYFVESEVLKNA